MMVLERRAPPIRPGSEIDRLRMERDKLREALRKIADLPNFMFDEAEPIARAALKETKGE